jgi:hypothetical protein
MQLHRLGGGEPLEEPVRPVRIHQKADAAAMHAENRPSARRKAVQRFQHEAVAAERDDDVGLLRADGAVAFLQFGERPLRRLGIGREKSDAWGRSCGGHPPVTLIWRATAGRLCRRSMMKS